MKAARPGGARRYYGACVVAAGILGLAMVSSVPGSVAQDNAALPRLHTNEEFLNDLSNGTGLDISDVRQVFRFVLGSLPPRVRVYPTENYYYFYFYHRGIRYAGNLRFDIENRDHGEVNFIYFKATTDWQEDDKDNYATFGRADGVAVEKVKDLVYRVSFEDKSVTFALNDLSDVRPPAGSLAQGERFIGPIFDESGIRFFLIFDDKTKTFHYVLDETVPVNDELFRPAGLNHILLGRRTGFAFAADGVGDRKVLIGVFGPNAEVNNYLDGPFDQLPDNFLKGDELKDALLLAMPEIKADQIDRFGRRKGEQSRELIAPYMEYSLSTDLAAADKCIAERKVPETYPCLVAALRQ